MMCACAIPVVRSLLLATLAAAPAPALAFAPQPGPEVADMPLVPVSPGDVDPTFPVDELVPLVDPALAPQSEGVGTAKPQCLTPPDPVQGDFDDDGFVDIVWRNRMSGQDLIWTTDGNLNVTSTNNFIDAEPDQDWDVRGNGWFGGSTGTCQNGVIGCFDADAAGLPAEDLVWRNLKQGQNAIWQLNGSFKVKQKVLIPGAASEWQIDGTGDFNCDGFTDILWRNLNNGSLAVWYMKKTSLLSSALFLNTVGSQDWQIYGVGDFNADNWPDLLWRNTATGENVVWLMVGTSLVKTVALPKLAGTAWVIGAVGDFKMNGIADILWRNTQTGQNAVWVLASGPVFKKSVLLPAVQDQTWSIVAPR